MYHRTEADEPNFLTDLYRKQIRQHAEPLSDEEAVTLLQQWNSSPEARERLVLHFLPIACGVGSRYKDRDEAIALASTLLLKVMERATRLFDPTKGRLRSYIAAGLTLDLRMTLGRQQAKTRRNVSLDEPIATSDDGESLTHADVIPAAVATPEAELQRKETADVVRTHLALDEYAALTESGSKVEIANVLGVPVSRVTRLRERAVAKLYRVPDVRKTLETKPELWERNRIIPPGNRKKEQ